MTARTALIERQPSVGDDERLARLEQAIDCIAQLLAQGQNVNRLGRIVGSHQPAGIRLLEILAEIRAEKE